MDLTTYPRRRYLNGITPIEKLSNLSRELGGPTIYIKRDDQLGLTAGGNKTRKLEFVMADALLQGCDTIITCGAVQSNHCRLTLAAARKEGLKCWLMIEERIPGTYDSKASGNNFLFNLLDADKLQLVPGNSNETAVMAQMAAEAVSLGLRPYIIDGSNACAMSSLGYVACAQEIMQQLFEMSIHINHIITPSGSGGTHAGLQAGMFLMRSKVPVTGINVRRAKMPQIERVYSTIKETVLFLGYDIDVPERIVQCMDDVFWPGYSLPNDQMIEAVKIAARTEGILLDPVYSGKAMAGLIHMIRQGRFSKKDNVLFLHTGGSPALYFYQDYFFEDKYPATRPAPMMRNEIPETVEVSE